MILPYSRQKQVAKCVVAFRVLFYTNKEICGILLGFDKEKAYPVDAPDRLIHVNNYIGILHSKNIIFPSCKLTSHEA